MTILIDHYVPGDYIDIDAVEVANRDELLNGLEGAGYQLSSRGILGLIETCENCDGDGLDNGKDRNCRMCSGSGVTLDEGRGKHPYWD